jgi:type I restriction-modification system DNA methylase subunit
MAKKISTNLSEGDTTNIFTRDILSKWDKLIPDKNTGLKWRTQVSLPKEGHNRPDIVAELDDNIKLIVELKNTNSTRTFNQAKRQLEEYIDYFEGDGFICIGIIALHNTNTNQPEPHVFLKVNDSLIEDNPKGLSCIDHLDNVLNRVKYQNSDKEEDYKPLIEKEIKSQIKRLHEMIRNSANIKSESKVYILNACVFACGFEDFRKNVASYNDDGTYSSKIAARINYAVMESSPSVMKSIKYSLNSMESNDQALNNKNVKYKNYITNPKYHVPGENEMSIVKAICCFITGEIFEKIEKTYKNATLDISSILYHEFIKYTRGDGKANGIVLTADHISRLMAKLAITSPQDKVLDVCAGSGSLLLASRDRKRELVKTEEDERYINEGYMGVEYHSDMFFLAYTNLHFNKMSIENVHVNDCHKVTQQEYDDFGATCGILNPPYSMVKKGVDPETHAEWAFAFRALQNIKKGGKLVIIIPISCGCKGKSFNTKFKKRIMENNTLEKIIKINHQAFATASTYTQIFVFTAGIPHDENKNVLVIDYTEDGYNMQSEKFRITGDIEKLEDRIIDICINNKEVKGISHFETFTNDKEWVYLPENDEMYNFDEINNLIYK